MKKKMSQKEVNKGSKTTKASKTNNKPHVGPTTDGPHIRQSDDIGPKFSGPSAARHNHAGSSGGGPRMAGASDDEQEEAEEEVEPDPVFDYESETLVTPENSEDEREKYEFPQYNEASGFGEVYFELGMEFATIESFKNALKDHVIFEGRKIRYIKNDQRRVRCDCEHGVERIKKPRKSKKDNDASKENEESNKDNGEDAIDGDSGNVEERATVEEGHVDGESKETAKETNDSTVVVSGTTQAIIPNPCIPCVHALAAIARRGDRPEGYVHPLLKIGAARATYQPCIKPVNSEEYWDKIEVINPIPPKLKRPVGRPVKRRKKEPSENETSGSKVKKTFRVTCSKCGETGHNQKTCKGPAAPNRRSTKLRRSTNAQSTAKTTNQAAEEMHVSQSAPQVQNVVDHPNPIQPAANAPGFVSSMGAANSGATIPHSARAKQPIIRPHYPAPVQSSTPPPIPPPRPSQGVSAATITAASKGTTSRMFQFIPNPGFKHPRQK
ncbi:hypothetical protein Ahy_B03g062631 [Arachis hypogaea]|uniref:CCHC-type domain-containing protein n=1 Tax=Arachis hypogaea TaxID=3818 RepID=A0A444ZUS5_ARAHY|nr:hypothetical protein Ahy_B03g062631 [Arachis hypogaea]